jgi:DNA-binding phage protein
MEKATLKPVDSEAAMNVIKRRMEDLDIDLAGLVRLYCDIRQAKGDTKATVNRRSQLVNALERSNPTLETFLDLVDALDGEIQIVWIDRKVEKL